MTENPVPGPMSMIKIDGSKIKQLREQQGLTQLYLATAVEVTTDTISRWENKRYPTIKKENGLKLAEALGVDLEEILDNEDQLKEEKPQEPELDSPTLQSSPKSTKLTIKKTWPLLLLSAVMMMIISAVIYFFLNSQNKVEVAATRIAPLHGIAQQPLPIVIRVTETGNTPIGVIINEHFPKDAKVVLVSPPSTVKSKNSNSLKWLAKVQNMEQFSYIVQLPIATVPSYLFSGTASYSNKQESLIGGVNSIEIGNHHWADLNKDNIISDKEILTVYDNYSEIEGFEGEIDTVEEIWLGTGYNWDMNSNSYKIFD